MAVPPGVIGDGMLKVSKITTFAGTLTAVAATAGKDLTCYFPADGFNRTTTEDTVQDDRLCSTQDGEEPGRYKESLEVMFVWDPQNGTPTDNEAYNAFVPGSKGFLVIRYGILFSTAYAAAQITDVIQYTAGQRKRMPVAKNEKMKISQKLFIPAGGVTYDLALT
jgi:hypothetical protein